MWIESLQLECEELANTSEDPNSAPLLVRGSSQKRSWSGNSGYQMRWLSHEHRHVSCPRKVCFHSQVFVFKLLISNRLQNGLFPQIWPMRVNVILACILLLCWSELTETPTVSGSCKMTTYSWETPCLVVYIFLKTITSTVSLRYITEQTPRWSEHLMK